MPMILRTCRFKGNLLDLIGKTAPQAVAGLAPPSRVVEGGGYERLVWEDIVEDSDDGRSFPIRYVARLFQGRVTEVGIHSNDYLFVLDHGEAGNPYFAAVPKEDDFEEEDVNWIGLRDGEFFNKGTA